MRHAALPLALASCVAAIAASESPIADLRAGVELGVGTTTEYLDSSTTDRRTTVDDAPRRFSLGYVRGLGESVSQSPIVGLQLLYGRSGGVLEDGATSGVTRADVTTLGLDLEGGYAFLLPSAPTIQIEATVFAGYLMQRQDLKTTSGTVGTGGEGFESGVRLSAIRNWADGWQVGATGRYLFESSVETQVDNADKVHLTTRGIVLGLIIGHRL